VDHGLAGFAVEGFLELGHVGDDSVDAGDAWGVGIGDGADAEVFRAIVLAGPLGHADEKALVGRKAVDGCERLTFGLLFPGHVGDECAAEIGYVNANGTGTPFSDQAVAPCVIGLFSVMATELGVPFAVEIEMLPSTLP